MTAYLIDSYLPPDFAPSSGDTVTLVWGPDARLSAAIERLDALGVFYRIIKCLDDLDEVLLWGLVARACLRDRVRVCVYAETIREDLLRKLCRTFGPSGCPVEVVGPDRDALMLGVLRESRTG